MIVNLKDYSWLFEGEDATLALQEALRVCGEHPGSTLRLGGGVLHFYPKYVFQKEYYISNNDYSLKSIVFPLLGMEDLTIDGEGAQLLFHGALLPFVVDGCENITIRNLSVDYPHPFYFQAKILQADMDSLTLEYDPHEFSAKAENGTITFFSREDGWSITKDRLLACEFDANTRAPSAYIPSYFAYFPDEDDGSFLSGMYRYVKPVQLEEGKIRLEGKIGHCHTPGNMWVCTFAGRENPGIFGNQSKNLTLEKVTLYHTPSMGVICQLCENVTMVELKTVPRPDSGRFLSVNADATHFVHCTGAIRYEGCTFTNMLDDAGNVHGNYTKIDKKLSSTSLLAEFGHFQQRGVNPYSPGDRIHIVDNRTLLPICTLTVKSARLLSSRWVRLETEEPLPEIREGYTVENFTKMPELYIHNCVCGYNRPRGFLPGTWKKTVITHNTFFNMMHAVAFTGDCNDWFESGPVSDVLIRHNQFRNASYTGGAVIDISPRVKEGTAPFHKNIRIEDNVFELHEKRFLSAHHVENLTMEGNTFIENPSLPRHPPIGDSGVYLENCPHAEIQLPAEEKREKKSQ